mgnify:FL=1
MVSLSSVVIFFQGISLPRSPVTTQLIILSTLPPFYFIRNGLVFHSSDKPQIYLARQLKIYNWCVGSGVLGYRKNLEILEKNKREKTVFLKP